MFDYQRANNSLIDLFRSKSILNKLIIINISVWFLINLIKIVGFLFQQDTHIIIYYLAVPSSLDTLFQRPWTILTYMFLHENFFHLFFNMILLYVSGKIFLEYLSERKLLFTYISGGIAGAIFYIVSYNGFPVFRGEFQNSIALGASASVLSILIAIAYYIPNYAINLLFIGRIKLSYIALIFIAIDLISIDKGNPGGHLAHLGGALWGFTYIFFYKKNSDIYRFFSFFNNIKNPFKRKKSKLKVDFRNTEKPLSDDEYNTIRVEKQKKIDIILEKISKSGYESLTKAEKDFLFNYSNKK